MSDFHNLIMLIDKNYMKLSLISLFVFACSYILFLHSFGCSSWEHFKFAEDFMTVPFFPVGTGTVVLPSLSCLTGI